jgi:hypothetical protein
MRYDLVLLNSDLDYKPRYIRKLCHRRSTVVVFGRRLLNLAKLARRLGPICDVFDVRPAIYNGETFISGIVLSYGSCSPFRSRLVYLGSGQLHEQDWIRSVNAKTVICVNFPCATLMAQYPNADISEVNYG